MRMTLVGLEPALRARIKTRAETIIRTFDGAPENVAEFNEAQRLIRVLDSIEAGQ